MYLSRGPESTLIGALTTMIPCTLLDPDAPVGSTIVTIGIEREALRDDWFVISDSMLDEITKESWAGVYVGSITDILPREGDLKDDALVDGADLSVMLGAWGRAKATRATSTATASSTAPMRRCF